MRPVALAIATTALLAVLPACSKDAPKDTASGSKYRATITRTEHGVPHIVADDMASVVFGQGWASYQDHACDLADQLVKIRGERAKFFGAGDADSNVKSDMAWKTIGIVDRAAVDYESADQSQKDLLDAFARGWSTANTKEPTKLWCGASPWLQSITGFDVYAYARSVTLLASSAQLTQYLGTAQPPGSPQAALPSTTAATGASTNPWPAGLDLASNGWAIGSDRSETGEATLMANPHFPWDGALRFSEVHLTVPGQLDIYGAMLAGLPSVGIGFTKEFAWTHTVSAGHRFTLYKLALQPGNPTSYLVDGTPKQMTSKEITVEVKGAEAVKRTVWYTDTGPIVDFPGVGWSDTTTLSLRDANIDNTQLLDQYLAMTTAKSFDEFKEAHKVHQGVPLFNTIAVGRNGEAWYADTSATPDLSPEAIEAWEVARKDDVFTRTADQNGVVLLDGSTSKNDWVVEPGARSPGLVPYSKMPMTTRRDYLFNANDSFWMSNADHPLSGDYSPMHGDQALPQGMRTRENAAVLRDTTPEGPAGADGRFSLDEVKTAALRNGAGSARFQLDGVRQWCTSAPADLAEPCAILTAWDGRFDLDSVGAVLWRQYFVKSSDGTNSVPWDPSRPIDTPIGAATPALIENGFREALKALAGAGLTPSSTLRTTQLDGRVAGASAIPLGGGTDREGVTNVLGYDSEATTLEPLPDNGEILDDFTGLRNGGFRINYGSSFLLAVRLGADVPVADSILTYGQTEDRTSPWFTSQTKLFSDKEWKPVRFTSADIDAHKLGDPVTVSA